MSKSQTCKVLGRIRHPSERLTNYTTQELRERGKKQAKVAAARGNASQPEPLKPLQRERNGDDNNEEEEADDDNPEAGPALLDYRLEQLNYEGDRIKWLYQAIRKLGVRTNYCDDPDFQAEGPLSKEWKRLVLKASLGGAPAANKDHRIKTGLTHVLKPATSGHSCIQLVRTNSQTVGLDKKTINTHDHREYGRLALPKLARTDKTTITLDSKVVSPPRVAGPSGMKKRPSDGKPSPPKKRAIVPLARILELCHFCQVRAKPPRSFSDDEEMADPPINNPNRPLRPVGNEGQGRNGLGDNEGEDEGGNGGEVDKGDDEGNPDHEGVAAAAGGDGDDGPGGYGRLTQRQRSQLRTFSADACGLVAWTADKVKVKMATICPWPETMTQDRANNQTYLEHWLLNIWYKANVELHNGLPHLPFLDEYGTYIRNLIPAIRNGVKRSCEAMVPLYFELKWSDPHRAALVNSLTDGGDERWISLNLENNNKRFKHPIIRNTIKNVFFRNDKSFGNTHLDEFTPLVPLPTIACIRNQIKSYVSEKNKDTNLNSTSNADAFTMYMKMMEKIHQENPAHLLEAQRLITEQYVLSQPEPMPVRVPEMNFGPDRNINMGPLEQIKARFGDRVAAIKDWAPVNEIQSQGKGKGQAD
ncbi:hypothetical protein FRC12_010188 [Ceratobasidium sp. 428]|nr:hypothetical protein FRC12_010188 [Ceratobasidium sp. 428]